jgi:polyisoprenoid-binding protein YceI
MFDHAEMTIDRAEIMVDHAEMTIDRAEIMIDHAEMTIDRAEIMIDRAEMDVDRMGNDFFPVNHGFGTVESDLYECICRFIKVKNKKK